MFLQILNLFTAAAEYKGIAAFKAHDNVMLFRHSSYFPADFLLRKTVVAGSLAYRNEQGVAAALTQKMIGNEIVIEDDVRLLQQAEPTACYQVAASGTSADEIYLSCHVLSSGDVVSEYDLRRLSARSAYLSGSPEILSENSLPSRNRKYLIMSLSLFSAGVSGLKA